MTKIRWATVPGIAALAAILTIGLAGTATAFHDGGVAHCDGCHSMHNSPDNPVTGTANSTLLKGTDASSTCLNCHAGNGSPTSYHVLSGNGSAWTPGGDFFWLTQSYSNVVRGNTVTSDPDQMGHNVIAMDFGLHIDGNNTQAPGGTYSAALLSCASCHNPHGQVNGGTPGGQDPISVSGSYGDIPPAGTIAGSYRLLGSNPYGAISAPAPIAVIPYATRFSDADDASHVAYGQGMSEWCASCHSQYLSAPNKHPAGNLETLSANRATTYNAYVATGDFTGGSGANAYTGLVPFERQETDKTVLLAAATSTQGPTTSDNVMCLTCHRAHASAFENITRWDMGAALLAEGYPSAANLVAMGAVANADYLGRDIATDFGEYQRSLCNKCHAKD